MRERERRRRDRKTWVQRLWPTVWFVVVWTLFSWWRGELHSDLFVGLPLCMVLMIPFDIALDELDRDGHRQMLRAALWGAAFGLGLPLFLFLASWAARGFPPVSPVPLAAWAFFLFMAAFGAVLFVSVAAGVLLWRDRKRSRGEDGREPGE